MVLARNWRRWASVHFLLSVAASGGIMLDFVNPGRVGPGVLHGESVVDPDGHPDLGKEVAMSRFVRAVLGHRATKRQAQRGIPNRLGGAVFSCCAVVVMAIGLVSTRPSPLLAGDETGVGPMPQAGAAQPPSRFVAESRETLKRLQEKLTALGAQILADLGQEIPTDADVASQSLMVESAKARYQHALHAARPPRSPSRNIGRLLPDRRRNRARPRSSWPRLSWKVRGKPSREPRNATPNSSRSRAAQRGTSYATGNLKPVSSSRRIRRKKPSLPSNRPDPSWSCSSITKK